MLYIAGVICAASFNPFQWNENIRMGVACTYVCIMLMGAAVTITYTEENKK